MLAKGPKLEARTARGDTALLLAVNAGAVEIVDKLLPRRADKDIQNEFGDTALIIASRNGNAALVQRLLKAGASTRCATRTAQAPRTLPGTRLFGHFRAAQERLRSPLATRHFRT